ncbi:TetR/AcrR family transcriptional regulator [Nonomuraea sp. NPDC049309]|uniref:TetR/AcrR family transcriptional regulator n=1 Tax=Nonomuraea sp. NPDC049309 TaxID=3364350 RepID=UPI00371E00D8
MDDGVELLWRDRGEGSAPRAGLTLDRIVRAGIELADAEGLEGLSMRKVADRLGFTTMSLYRHVPGRDRLVALMRDAVMGEQIAEDPSERTDEPGNDHPDDPRHERPDDPRNDHPDGHRNERLDGRRDAGPGRDAGTGRAGRRDQQGPDWRPRLEALARQGWRLRRRHPWLAEVRGSRDIPGPNAVATFERMLSTLADTPLRPHEVIAAVNLIGRFVDAEALSLVEILREERSSGVSEEEWWGARDSLYERLTAYPTITRLWESGGWDDPEDSFEFGLRRILDGIEVLIQERDETRDDSCRECGRPLEPASTGRPRVYCSRACQQRAYRTRKSRDGAKAMTARKP